MFNRQAETIGLISDTHGLLRPEVLEHFSDCDLILHAGDIGNEQIIKKLGKIAPVITVHGNMDSLHLCRVFPDERSFLINDLYFYMTHVPTSFIPDINGKNPDIVIFGHTHRAEFEKSDGTTFLNPGSAGPGNYSLPATIMKLVYSKNNQTFIPEVIDLKA